MRPPPIANGVTDCEGRLVFALAGGDDGMASELAGGGANLSWERLARIGAEENALIALRDYLRRRGEPAAPRHIERQLAIVTLHIEAQMRATRRRAEELIVALNAAGIEPLLLKGAALAATVYETWEARPMRDIDLLVREDQLEAARTAALAHAWVPHPTLPDDSTYATHHHLTPLVAADGAAAYVEIHRSLLPVGHPFSIDYDEVYRQAERITVGAGRAAIMQRHHHAVYMATHLVWSHQLRTGGWHTFRDLSAMSSHGGLDWDAFVTAATRWGAASCAYWMLRLGRALARIAVPPETMEQLRPSMPEAMLSHLERHFSGLLLRSDRACPSVGLERALWSLAIQPRRSGHRRIRPWTVSTDLAAERTLELGPGPERAALFAHVGRCSMYLASLL